MLRKLILNFKFALRGLKQNKLRSILTLLGILIGIGSVIGLLSIGKGAEADIVSGMETLGTDIVTVNPGVAFTPGAGLRSMGGASSSLNDRMNQDSEGGVLTLDDFEFLEDNLDSSDVDAISPVITARRDVVWQEEEYSLTVNGVNSYYKEVYDLEVDSGRFLTESDVEGGEMVVVLGSDVLEGDADDFVSHEITIDDDSYTIVGVLKGSEESLFGSDPDNQIFFPYTTAGTTDVSSIVIKASDDDVVGKLSEEINERLSDFRNLDEDDIDFNIMTVDSLVDQIQGMTSTMTMLLACIAAISLLVGGIGISNVMLITVTERTREIGIRKAVGAKRMDILMQFLFEAILLTLIGGILGIGFGYLLGILAKIYIGFSPLVTVDSVLLATSISIVIGVAFGFIPAITASKLNPIEALRYE